MIVRKLCPNCQTVAEVVREFILPTGTTRVTQYACGHYVSKKILQPKDLQLVSRDGKVPYKFQLDGASFAVRSGPRCLIADEQGLGKTIQAFMTIKSDPAELMPYLIIGKAKLKLQYMKEAIRWMGQEYMPQILDGENDFLLPVRGFILSYDVLRRFKDLDGFIKRLGIKTVILDEIQAIKNHDSQRTNCVRALTKNVPYILGLSGTPIKNNALEYFPILNILHPDKFPGLTRFQTDWCDTYSNGYSIKTGGIKDYKKFSAFTKEFIIRRRREEVLPDLPLMTRNALFAELGPEVEKAYRAAFKQYYDLSGQIQAGTAKGSKIEQTANLMAYLSKMRHLAGIAKVAPCMEFLKDFLASTDRKITIFVHHKDVAVALQAQLMAIGNDEVSQSEWNRQIAVFAADTKDMQVQQDLFWSPNCRVAIASTLAAGEGLNLQCCSDMVLLERQWNPANEEQAEGRFIRIGQAADRVTGTYLVAVGTVDEFFAEIVERKRSLVLNSLDGANISWHEQSLIQELNEILMTRGAKAWGWK